jgi:tyrosyl-tRNA synthetase
MNGDPDAVAKKKQLITRNLQETLGEDRLNALLRERDLKVIYYSKHLRI